MPGTSVIVGDESIIFADNMSFNGTERGGKMVANGQLWIGSTIAPHVRLGALASSDNSVLISLGSGTIDLKAGSTTPTLFTADSGTASPASNNINLFGGSNGIDTIAVGSTITFNFDVSEQPTIPTSFPTPSGTATPALNALTFANGSGISISGAGSTVTVAVNSATVGQTITGDTGGALSPTLGNWNILGQQAGTLAVMDTIGSISTINIEDRTWISSLVVDPSATIGLRGTFTTIQSAINAATAGQNIYIRPGTYTENLTLKTEVNLFGLASPGNILTGASVTTILGVHTYASAGGVSEVILENLLLKNNGAGIIIVDSSTTSSTVVLNRCTLYITDNAVAAFTGFGTVICNYCNANDDGTGFYFNSTTSLILRWNSCNFRGTNTVANTLSTGSVTMWHCLFSQPITTASTAALVLYNSTITQVATTAITHGGTSVASLISNCSITGNISIGAGAALPISNTTIKSTSGTPISGAGSLSFSNVSFPGTVNAISVTTQIPKVSTNDAVKVTTPGGYPYTTLPQDAVILVDTSSARTIAPLASPTTGQMHIIKDSVGSAAANNITITPSGKNIDGAASSTINLNYGSATIVYNGTEWSII